MSSYCVFDDNIPIDEDNFAVGIMRKPNGKNSEHAFLVVEGRDSSNQTILRRYDLYFDEKNNPEKRAGITIWPEEISPVDEAKSCFLEKLLSNKEVESIAWSITKQKAESLHQDILRDQENPPIYQVSGDRSLLAQSSSREGQSCFTWARQKLYNLKEDRIKLPERYSDFLVAVPSLHIGKKKTSSNGCNIF